MIQTKLDFIDLETLASIVPVEGIKTMKLIKIYGDEAIDAMITKGVLIEKGSMVYRL